MSKSLHIYIWCFLLFNTLYAQSNSYSQVDTVTLNESVENVLGRNAAIDWQQIVLDTNQKTDIKLNIKVKTSIPDTLDYAEIFFNKKTYYLIVDEAPGKTETFNYALYLNEDFSIKDIDVLIYRELYGGEIDDPPFRQQFSNISYPQQLIFGRSIQGITGATISSRSITYHARDIWMIFKMVLVDS